ncbi:MAG: response regulator [Bacteroidales bacterium]
MSTFNRLVNFLSYGLHSKCDEQTISRIIFINLLSLAGCFLFLVYGTLGLIRGEFIHGLISLFSSLLIFASIQFVKKTGKYLIAAQFNLTLVIVILFTMFAFEQTDGSIILWFTLVPVLTVFILGNKNGTIISVSFLLITVIFSLLPEDYTYKPEFSNLFTLRFIGLYIALYFIASIAEYYRVNHLRAIEMQLLEAKNETKLKESFISKLSHQIRTPLSNIMLVGHMVDKVNLTDDQRDLMETIIASANNLVNTIENIAEIAEVDIESKKNLQKTGFNLYSALNNTIRLFTVQKEPVVDFSLSIDNKLKQQELEGDPVRLKQIFLNLIETILKNKRPGKINISIFADIQGKISDITEIRFEIKTSKPINLAPGEQDIKSSGSGFITQNYTGFLNNLDLNIARKIIIQLGGKLHILQTQEKNQVFLFTLPFRAATDGGPKEKKVPSKEEMPSESPGNQEKLKETNILVVEDNTINQKIVVLSLNKYINNIDVANNGKEALDKFGTSKYDVILMDVQMPVIDGFIATKKIREIEATTNSHTPIIAITANALHGDKEKCLAAGMDDYISKPFQVEVLIDKIINLLYKQ